MSLKSDFTPLFPEEDAQHSSELQHQPSPHPFSPRFGVTPGITWSNSTPSHHLLVPLWGWSSGLSPPQRLKAAGGQGMKLFGGGSPNPAHRSVLGGLGCSPCSAPGGMAKEMRFPGRESRDNGRAQGTGSRRGWGALGMPAVPCSEGQRTAQPAPTPQP